MTNNEDTPAPIGAVFEGFQVPSSPFLPAQRARQIARGNYERPERKLAAKLVTPGDRIVELGAGIGFVGGFTVFNAPDTSLRSFEANPALLPHIESLYAMNGIADRARVENRLVVSRPDAPETLTFHIHGSFLGSSLFPVGRPDLPKPEIPTLSWDALKADFAPTVLLMDIEGAELDFLSYADLSGLRVIVVELHPGHYGSEGAAACIDAITAQGFKPVHHRMDVRTFVREGVDVPR